MIRARADGESAVMPLVAAVLAFAIFAAGSWSAPILGQDEARFAQAAREMMHRGETIVPSFAGEPRYDKPILIYWLMIVSYHLAGVSVFAARLPSHLAGALVVALLCWWARRRGFDGLLAVSLLVATPMFFIEACAATADMVLILMTVISLLALESLWRGRRTTWPCALLFWFALGLSVLTKGPVGPAVVAAIWIALWALERTWTRLELIAVGVLVLGGAVYAGPLALLPLACWAFGSSDSRQRIIALRPLWGLVVMGVVLGPWAVAAHLATGGDFFAVAIGHHVLTRSVEALEGHGGFPGFYPVTAVVTAFPWFGALACTLGAIVVGLRDDPRGDAKRLVNPDRTRSVRFLVAWLVGPVIMFETMQTRMAHYTLISAVAGVLVVAAVGPEFFDGRRWRSITAALLTALGAISLAAVPLIVWQVFDLGEIGWAAIFPAAAALAALCCIPWRSTSWSRRRLHALAAVSIVFLLVLVAGFLPLVAERGIVQRTDAAVRAERRAAEDLVVYKLRDDELAFALPIETRFVRSRDALAQFAASQGSAFLGLARRDDFRGLSETWSGPPFEVAARVEGLDLGRGRRAEMVLFRPGWQ